MTTRRIRVLFTLLGVLVGVTGARAELVLGVQPFKPAVQIVQGFAPLADYLGEAIGQPIVVRVSPDYAAHLAAVGEDRYDIAYMGPATFVKLTRVYGSRPLLARQALEGKGVFQGKIVVAQNSPVRSLADLKGRSFAFGPSATAMGHQVPRFVMWRAGVTLEHLASYKFLVDHNNVALGVLAGDFDAGAVKDDVFFQYESRGLRVIATTPPVATHLLIANRSTPPDTVQRLREALLRISADPRSRTILNGVTPGVTGFVPVKQKDYDNLAIMLSKLREIGVED